MSVDSECATCSVLNIDELHDDCVGGRSKEGEQKHEPELCWTLLKHTALRSVTLLFYVHSIGECDEKHIVNW
jgi:hypothetical protein